MSKISKISKKFQKPIKEPLTENEYDFNDGFLVDDDIPIGRYKSYKYEISQIKKKFNPGYKY